MKFMIFFKGSSPCPGSAEAHKRRWGSWIAELKERGILEDVSVYGIGRAETGPRLAGGKLTGYLIVNVSTEEEALDIAREAPDMALEGPSFCGTLGDVKVLGFQVC
jgi:hypothetical protein